MKNLDKLCDQCATHGVHSIPDKLRAPEDIESLAQACTARIPGPATSAPVTVSSAGSLLSCSSSRQSGSEAAAIAT